MNEIIIIILLFIGVMFFNSFKNKMENFVPIGVKYIKRRNAKLNHYGGVDYVDEMPPCYRGEYGCRSVPCPPVFEKDIICWTCPELTLSNFQ